MRDSVPSGSDSSVCNVLRQWQSRSSLLIESIDSMIESTDSMIIIVYMYLIGNGILIRSVYVWYRDLVVSLELECT